MKSCLVGRDGARHLILCKVILGRAEIVKPDTKQCYPSCENYDSGVDSFSAPTKYMIWSSRMNTHVWPAYVISFRVSSFKGLCLCVFQYFIDFVFLLFSYEFNFCVCV